MTNEKSLDHRRTRFIRKPIGYLYADISIEFESKTVSIDDRTLKLNLLIALKNMFGDQGASVTLDIIKFNSKLLRVFLRFSAKHLVIVRSALTLTRSIEDRKCVILIHKITHSLSSLIIDQQQNYHNIIS